MYSNSSLSVELYSDPAHFVLELIQNLDDTAYPPNVTPTATFQLQGKTLTVESNQSGFTEADVLSICDMGQSSKLPADGIIKDSIGEKGIGMFTPQSCFLIFHHLPSFCYFPSHPSSSHALRLSAFTFLFITPSSLSYHPLHLLLHLTSGFRSVFAAANRVQIFSNNYNFEFDRNRPLGMVCPTELNITGPHRKTLFILHLSLDEGVQMLQETLTSLDPDMLLFLRRLRCLQVVINGARAVRHNCSQTKDFCYIDSNREGVYENTSYLMVSAESAMPTDNEKRAGGRTTTTLAFPMHASGPIIRARNICAFLPVRKTPFTVSPLAFLF
jgi:hypothetical protein